MPSAVMDFAPIASEQDLSVHALDRIFGHNWFSMFPDISGSSTIIVEMLKLLNEFAMFGLTVLFAATFATAVVGTAHEGQPLGKRLHSFWVPVRFSLSTGMLVPMANGLCLFQLVLLAVVGWSIHGANQLWGLFLDSAVRREIVSVADDNTVNISPGLYTDARKIAADILENLVVIKYLENSYPNTVNAREVARWKEEKDGFLVRKTSKWVLQFVDPATLIGDNSKFGHVEVVCYATPGMCNRSMESVATLVDDLQPIAHELALRGTNKGGSVPSSVPFKAAVTKFADTQARILQEAYTEELGRLNSQVDTFLMGATEIGWIGAGSFYHTILGLQSKARDAAQINITSVAPDVGARHDGLRQYDNTMQLATAYQSQLDYDSVLAAAKAGGSATLIETIFGQNFNVAVVGSLADSLAKSDPIHGMAAWGNGLVLAGTGAFATFTALDVLRASGSAAAKSQIFGWAADKATGGVSGVSAGLETIMNRIAPIVYLVAGALFAAGMLLAFYIPAVPFVIWVSGVIGWLMLVIEAMVLAPVWIVAQAMPEGEGMAGQYGSRGYLLFLGILVRPFLMLLGLCTGMLLMGTVGKLIAVMITTYIASWEAHAPGIVPPLLSTIAFIFILAALLIIFCHKVFGLIQMLPDHVLHWIGGNMPTLGEGTDEDKTHSMMGAVIRRTEQTATGAGAGRSRHTSGQQGAQAEGAERENTRGGETKVNEQLRFGEKF